MNGPKQNLNNIKPTDISLGDLFDLFKKEIMLSFNCHASATVQSFNKDEQTVQATINYKKTFQKLQKDGTYKLETTDYPLLIDVPAIILGGGGFSQRFPIKKGDTCYLLFNDRDLDNWFDSGQVVGVATGRLHSFSDAVAIVGLRSKAGALENYDPDRYEVTNGKISFSLSEEKAKIANATKNLKTILDNLINAVKGLTVTGVSGGGGTSGPPDPATVIALENVATDLGGLLE